MVPNASEIPSPEFTVCCSCDSLMTSQERKQKVRWTGTQPKTSIVPFPLMQCVFVDVKVSSVITDVLKLGLTMYVA